MPGNKTLSGEDYRKRKFQEYNAGRELKAISEARTANEKWSQIGPEYFRMSELCELLGVSVGWFKRSREKSRLFVVQLKPANKGLYTFDFKAYFESVSLSFGQEKCGEIVKRFFHVGISNIERTGSFTRQDLTEKSEMADVNADFFLKYITLYKLAEEDRHKKGVYYWIGEQQPTKPELSQLISPIESTESTVIEERKPVEISNITIETEPDIKPPKQKRNHVNRDARTTELQERAFSLGPGYLTRQPLCRGTSVPVTSFQIYKDSTPYLTRAGSRRFFFNFREFFDAQKMKLSGLKLAARFDRFFRHAVSSIRLGTVNDKIGLIFSIEDLKQHVAIADENADFFIWYMITHGLIREKPTFRDTYEWIGPETFTCVADHIAPPQAKKPEPPPTVETSESAHIEHVDDAELQPLNLDAPPPIFKSGSPPRNLSKADLFGDSKPKPTRPAPLRDAVMEALNKQKKPENQMISHVSPVDPGMSRHILEAVLDLTQLVENLPGYSGPANSTGRVAELETAMVAIINMVEQVEQLLDAGRMVQGGAELLKIREIAMRCVETTDEVGNA